MRNFDASDILAIKFLNLRCGVSKLSSQGHRVMELPLATHYFYITNILMAGLTKIQVIIHITLLKNITTENLYQIFVSQI